MADLTYYQQYLRPISSCYYLRLFALERRIESNSKAIFIGENGPQNTIQIPPDLWRLGMFYDGEMRVIEWGERGDQTIDQN